MKFFKTQQDLRNWFEENHDKSDELWVCYYKKSTGKESIDWDQSVEEALCFGWIDGIRKSIDKDSFKIRFTPRRPNSNWSLKNIKTVEMLKEKGLIKPAGLKAFELRKESKSGVYSFEQEQSEFSKKYLSILKSNNDAWTFFSSQPPYYQKAVKHWVMSAKQEKTRLKRLNELIDDSVNGRKIKPMRRNGE